MKAFIFGVWEAGRAGHFLYSPDGRSVYPAESRKVLPCSISTLDGGLMPEGVEQVQGQLYFSVVNGWGILSAWDRTGDSRGNSLIAFLFDGVTNQKDAEAAAQSVFSFHWGRAIAPFQAKDTQP